VNLIEIANFLPDFKKSEVLQSVNDNLILTHLSHKSGNLNLTHPWFFH